MSCPGDNYLVPGANPCEGGGGGGVAGVSSLNNQTGVVNVVSTDGSVTVTDGAGQVNLAVAGSVTAVEGVSGLVFLQSPGGSISITTSGQIIQLEQSGGSQVDTLNGLVGPVTIVGAGITTVTTAGNVITVGTGADVTSINNATGAISIQGDPTGSATVQQNGATTSILVPIASVTNITGTNYAVVTSLGGVFNVDVPAPPSPTVTNITGSGIAVVTSAAGSFNVDVPTPPSAAVTNITGSGSAVVTQVGTVFNVDVTGGGGGGVTSLKGLTGALDIIGTNGTSVSVLNANTIAVEAPVSNVNGGANCTVSNAGTVFTVTVPFPTITSVTGSGSAVVTSSAGVYNVDVTAGGGGVTSLNTLTGALDIIGGSGILVNTPSSNMVEIAATINSVVGSGIATVTSASGIYTVDVPAPTITSVTGSGAAVVTSGGGVFNVDVTGVVAGVSAVNGITGNVNFTSQDSTVAISTAGNDVDLSVVSAGVSLLNTFTGTVNIVSNDATVTIVNVGNDIDLSVAPPGATVTSLNSLAGGLSCISSDGSIDITSSGVDIDFKIVGVPPVAGVTSINAEVGVVTITAGTGITITSAAGNIEISNTKTPDVITLNGLGGDLNLTSSDGSIAIAPSGTDIDLSMDFANLPTGYEATTTAISSLTTGVLTILSITFTITKTSNLFINGNLGINSSSSTPSRVLTSFRIGSTIVPFSSLSQSIQNIAPATTTYQRISNSAFISYPAGTYTLVFQGYASGVPSGTVALDTGGCTLNLITNIL